MKLEFTFKQLTQACISLIELSLSAILILGNYSDDLKKGAFTIIGVVIGYWLK
jgi:hypothetical protein